MNKKGHRSDTTEPQKKGLFGKNILISREGQKENTCFIDLHTTCELGTYFFVTQLKFEKVHRRT